MAFTKIDSNPFRSEMYSLSKKEASKDKKKKSSEREGKGERERKRESIVLGAVSNLPQNQKRRGAMHSTDTFEKCESLSRTI